MCAVVCIAQGALLHSWAVVSVARPASLTYCSKKCGSMQHSTHNMNDGACMCSLVDLLLKEMRLVPRLLVHPTAP